MSKPIEPSTLAEGHAAATALTVAAATASPFVQLAVKAGKFPLSSVYQLGGDEALHAAPAPAKPTRAALASEKPPKPQPREVPASVVAAAAAVGQAVVASPAARAVSGRGQGHPSASSGSGNAPTTTTTLASSSKSGGSLWLTAPEGVTADARLAIRLPEAEFTYIDRPWQHFVTRWAAIDDGLQKAFGEEHFSMLDLGSCCGFFSLQAAVAYPNAHIVGVEGSVGIGNGTIGIEGSQEQIIETKAIQTHLHWISRLKLPNCLVAPDVWDFNKVCAMASQKGYLCDVMLLLSVVHHMDNVSFEQYAAKGLNRVEGSLELMAELLRLAPRHFIELPDQPWLQHIYERFGTAVQFLHAAAKISGRNWRFTGPLVVSEWYGRRELWLLEEPEIEGSIGKEALLSTSAIFSKLLPEKLQSAQVQQVPPVPKAVAASPVSKISAQEHLGHAMLNAPTALIAAHLALRDAMLSADAALREVPARAPSA